MKNTLRKTIGNICLIGALICFALAMICLGSDLDDLFQPLCMLYAFGLILGIILRIGDFFKWRGKMFAQGINEASTNPVSAPNPPASGFCPHCGNGLASRTAFCPHCGNKL